MSAQYRIDLLSPAGVKLEEIIEYQSLRYVKKRNAPGELQFTLNANSPKILQIDEDAQIEVWRRNKQYGLDWYCDFYALHRSATEVTSATGVYTAICPGQLDKLNDRIVAYYSGAVNRSYFTVKPAETILNTLAVYNLTSAGTTTDSRVRLATMPGVSVETDQARGPVVALWDCAEEVLLETMQKLAAQYKVAFDLVKTGANTWEWRYIENDDVSDEQVFALERGNVRQVTLKKDRTGERTVAIVGGKGEGILKNYREVTGLNYDASSNNREMYVGATGEDTNDELDYQGGKALFAVESKPIVDFDILQTPTSYYGLHYNINSLVTGRYKGTDYQYVVSEVSVDFSSGKEEITVKLEDV